MGEAPGIADLLEASIVLEHAGDFGAALQRAMQALEQARAGGESEDLASALGRIGFIHYRLGHYREAQEYSRQALDRTGAATRTRADAWITLGNCAFEVETLAESEAYYVQAADLCRQIEYDHSRLRALHNLGAGVYTLRGQFDLALATYEEAYRLGCELDSPHKTASLVAMASLLQQTGQYSRARMMVEKFGDLDSAPGLYRGYMFMQCGYITLGEGNVDGAISWFTQARSIAEAIGDPVLNIFIRMGQSQGHRMSGNPAAACEWANDAVAWASRAGNHRMLGRTLIERGRARWLNNELEAAEADFRAAAQELAKRQQLYDLARADFFLAALLQSLKKAEAAAAWEHAARQVLTYSYASILDQDRDLAYSLIAAYLNSPDPRLGELSAKCMEYLQEVPPPPLRVITLGSFEVWQGGRRVEASLLRKRRAGELLVLLLLNPGQTMLFDQVVEALWPDKDPEAAQMLFHQATSALRRALEADLPNKFPSRYIDVEEGRVKLQVPLGSKIDLRVFEDHYRKGEWEEAVAGYTGEFLPEHLYAEWTTAPRQRMIQFFERALLKIARKNLTEDRCEQALEACQRLLEREPWNEQAALVGMRACLGLNDRSGALQLYRSLEESLHAEFGLHPQAEVQALYQKIITSV